MGLSEVAVVLLVAFLVLGPGRSISLARSAGKLMGDLKQTFSEVAAAASLEQQEDTNPAPRTPRPGNQAPTDQQEPGRSQVSPVDHFDPAPGPVSDQPSSDSSLQESSHREGDE